MKRLFSLLTAAMLVLCMTGGLFSGPARADSPDLATRTILLYGCGSNLESQGAMMTWNLYQILEAEIPEDVNVIVMTGGSRKWFVEPEYLSSAETIGESGMNQFWICSGRNAPDAVNGHGRMTLLTDAPGIMRRMSMADPIALQGFIEYAAYRFPAEMYDLVLWDHGGGPVGGFALDELHAKNVNDTMSLEQIVTAIKDSPVKHFDIIDFDACLMGSVEVVAALADCADYLVLSPETEPGFGQDYKTWMNALAKDSRMNGFELGRIIVDAFIAFYEGGNPWEATQDGTLCVVDTANFRQRLAGPVTRLFQMMSDELTTRNGTSGLFSFYDEYAAAAMTYAYYDETLLDLGNFADSLGICMYEIDGGAFFNGLTNGYSDLSTEIRTILSDCDGSGDDVIYSGATPEMNKPTGNRVGITRGLDGRIVKQAEIAPSGLSVFFVTNDLYSSTSYAYAMYRLFQVMEEGDMKTMLETATDTVIRYALVTQSGRTVSELLAEGKTGLTYRDVGRAWKKTVSMGEAEGNLLAMQLGTDVKITGIESSLWYACLWDLATMLLDEIPEYETDDDNWLTEMRAEEAAAEATEDVAAEESAAGPEDSGYADADTAEESAGGPEADGSDAEASEEDEWDENAYYMQEGEAELEAWLDPIIRQQETETIAPETTTAIVMDKSGDGVADTYRVTVNAPMRLIRNVSMDIRARVKVERDELTVSLFGDTVSLGLIHGSLSLDSLLDFILQAGSPEEGVLSFFTAGTTAYDLPTSVDSWYELVDSEGVGHIVSVGDIGSLNDTSLKIPVVMHLKEKDDYGDPIRLFAFLVYQGGRFTGFIDVSPDGDMDGRLMSLTNPRFDGATVETCQCMVWDFFGYKFYMMDAISAPFTLPETPSADRGMVLRMTKVSDIADLTDGKVFFKGVMTDMYGFDHSIEDALDAAAEENRR
ncbi:MAG: hypothetical protein IKI84_13860 [Clostridia bacterium]|nr:hypothetical protein [Clostridia bacterium]